MERTNATLELDHIVAAVFGLWDFVIPEARIFRRKEQLALPLKGPKKITPSGEESIGRPPKPSNSTG